MDKKISIILPCYNVSKYLDRCFNSLMAQTIGIDSLELIFVDDCSTDDTWDKLVGLERKAPESVMIIHSDENGRQGKARNIGLSYASAPYIGFVDSDDWVEPDMFEKLYNIAISYDSDIVYCSNWRDYGYGEQVLPPRQTGQESREFLIDTVEKRKTLLACSSLGFGVWDKLFKKSFLLDNNIYFPENLAYEDHFFSILLYFYAKKIYVLEERLYHYFINPNSTVLLPNASYHFDILTVDSMLWSECEARGLLSDYRQELEYQFLSLCYLAAMKMMALRLNNPPYDFFMRLKEETLLRVPNYHNNPYAGEMITDFNQLLLQLLDYPIDEATFRSVCNATRKRYSKDVLQIYIMTHVKFEAPKNPIYHPLHVGKVLNEDLGYMGDDTGENISTLNPYYSELTGLYWVWKNVHTAEYVGLCHYRRYFLTSDNKIMAKPDFIPILEKYDAIISETVKADKPYKEVYAEAHNIHDLEAVGRAIFKLYPDCKPVFDEVLDSTNLYCGNLLVTKKEYFDEYASWLFSVFDEASKEIDVSTYDAYHARVYGFLSEQLIYVWIIYKGLSYYECPIGFTQEKAETLELKERVKALMAKGNTDEALNLFKSVIKDRPDVMLPGSDFSEELKDLYAVLSSK